MLHISSLFFSFPSNITKTQGGAFHPSLEEVFKLVPSPEPGNYIHNAGKKQGYFELFMRYLNDTFPNSQHIGINSGKKNEILLSFSALRTLSEL